MTLAQAYVLLAIAIAGEIISTGTLKATEGFTKFVVIGKDQRKEKPLILEGDNTFSAKHNM